MNMMKSASTSGYFVHAVIPTVCDVEPPVLGFDALEKPPDFRLDGVIDAQRYAHAARGFDEFGGVLDDD
jgi:hypothetical protein